MKRKNRWGAEVKVAAFLNFDGTIALEDTTDQILERFADPAWRNVESEWIAGRIGSHECMPRQIDLVRASPEDIDAFAHDIEIDPGVSYAEIDLPLALQLIGRAAHQ